MEYKSTTTILDLNIYVLDQIFDNLYWQIDRVNLALAHPILSEAFSYHSRHRYRNICIQSFEIEEWRCILEHCGSDVLSLRDTSSLYANTDLTKEMMELAGKHCNNLQIIEFLVTSKNLKTVEDSLVKMKNLYDIKIKRSRREEFDIDTEKLIGILQLLPNLRKVFLDSMYWNVTHLRPLNNLANLQEFHFFNMEEFVVDCLSDLWGNLKSLTTSTSVKILTKLSKHCVSLETLHLIGYVDNDRRGFGYFPKLKHQQVVLLCRNNGAGLFLKYLHGKYNNQLESLVFPCGYISTASTARRLAKLQALKTFACLEIEPRCIRYIGRMHLEKLTLHMLKKTDLLFLLRECKSLRWLHLDESRDLNRYFIYELLDILNANGVEPEAPFELNVCRSYTGLRYNIVNELGEIENGKLLVIKLVKYFYKQRY